MSSNSLVVGLDIGSVSINAVVCSLDGKLVTELPYRRHFGRTLELCAEVLADIEKNFGPEAITRVVFTGTHGQAFARETGTFFELETTAQTRGLFAIMPDARSIIAIGGHDSALLIVTPGSNSFMLDDFKLNEACAAGTGSFIDQQAERIYADLPAFADIEDPQARIEAILNHFVAEGASSSTPANVACRCTVFTKSDMIHLQNKGIAIKHIIAGLHDGVAKNFKSTLITNRKLATPIAFIGGYAGNTLARRAFEKILGQPVVVPPHHTSIGAYGAVLAALADHQGKVVRAADIAMLKASEAFAATRTEPLALKLAPFAPCGTCETVSISATTPVEAYLGFDIGSTTTKLVLITPDGQVFYKRYIPTEGQPVVAIKKALRHCRATLDTDNIRVIGVGTTGSGREVANLFVGADDVVNEVTAHARGTTFYRPDVDTIFELGGQDAKYTALDEAFVVDFRMNKVCAAGTGSFLEETANKLGINIADEYESLAMAAVAPYKLTERCTVFMESDLMSFLQMGAAREDLLAGLSQAVVHNYLNRVVQDGRIGKVISFQGGPSLNKSVVAAFEAIVGKPIITLPHREVLGAIGAALHAQEELQARRAKHEVPSRFRGWDIVDAPFQHIEEICHRNPNCHNQCKLQIYRVGDNEAIYGGDCGLYESRSQAEKRTPDFGKIRQSLYFKAMQDRCHILPNLPPEPLPGTAKRLRIGLPRALSFFQVGLFWVHLLHRMGFDPVVTPETDTTIVDRGIEAMTCEACFPVKISHGHVDALKGQCDLIFLPLMIEMDGDPEKKGFYCPYIEANSFVIKASLGLPDEKILMPAIYLKEGKDHMRRAFAKEFARLGLPFQNNLFVQAYDEAMQAWKSFEQSIRDIGHKVLENLGNERAIVVVGRPYSAYDSRTNLNLFGTFSRLGVTAIPQEFLDYSDEQIDDEYPNMYWGFGQRIMQVARLINRDPRLFGLYLTSFSCGPDSFVLHFFNHEMGRTRRPYLELELDEHSAGAGVETRLLAFIDVIKNQRQVRTLADPAEINIRPRSAPIPLKERKIYIPKMSEGSFALAAAFEGVGCAAEVMPTYTKSGLDFGKSQTSGKECFPCIVTTGDMFHLVTELRAKQVDVNRETAFFMPETEGPCRFGQYSRLHRILLDKLGLQEIPILSPSSEDSYRFNGYFTDDQAVAFRQLAWQAIVYADLIEKALWRVRPYETERGKSDAVFAQAMRWGGDAIRRGGGIRLIKAARKAAGAFAAVPRRREQRPLIGIVGEIYVRTHRESNQSLVQLLEDLGCETYTSSIGEWIEYTTHTSIEDAGTVFSVRRSPGNFGELAKFWLTGKYQRTVASLIALPFRELLAGRFDHSTEHILQQTEGIFSNHINGEAILSIGGALSFAHDGFDGVVNAMPFTCMPSTIASSILKVCLRGKVPFVDMVYDGAILPNRETNLATFVFQARQHRQRKSA